MAVIFGADREWWVQNRVFREILAADPAAASRTEQARDRLLGGRSIGYLNLSDLDATLRDEVLDILRTGIGRVLEAEEAEEQTPEVRETVDFYRTLRDTASAPVAG